MLFWPQGGHIVYVTKITSKGNPYPTNPKGEVGRGHLSYKITFLAVSPTFTM